MTSVHVLGTTLIYVAHNLLIIKPTTNLVVYAFKHKLKQSYAFKQLEESLWDLQFPQANLHRAVTASQLRNKSNKRVFCSAVHVYLHTEENMEQLVEVVCTDPKWLASLFSVRYPWCFLVTGLKLVEDWSEMLDSYQTSEHWFIIHKKIIQ